MRRSSLDIKKAILTVLKKEGEVSLRELDIKVNTNYKTIREQVKELEFFKQVEIIKHEKSEKTGRPFTSVKLTE
ncbi:Uncharacterised protein [uncultured archaeon]|nr:Uncharacterised protein [uncultured archaeon]